MFWSICSIAFRLHLLTSLHTKAFFIVYLHKEEPYFRTDFPEYPCVCGTIRQICNGTETFRYTIRNLARCKDIRTNGDSSKLNYRVNGIVADKYTNALSFGYMKFGIK